MLNSILSAARSTASAAIGIGGGPFGNTHRCATGVLSMDDTGSTPSAAWLSSGATTDVIVGIHEPGSESGIPTIGLRVPDTYGAGRHQDLLMAASADGAPMHHVTLPSDPTEARLYSTLWLYLVGFTPMLFGVRSTSEPTAGDTLEFLVSGPIGRFRRVGEITVGQKTSGLTFSARNSGAGIRALPPVMNFHTR